MSLTTNYTSSQWNGTLEAVVSLQSPSNISTSVTWCNNTIEKDDNSSYKEFYETARYVTGLYVYPSICFPGVVCNMLTVIVFSRRNMLTSTNAFLSALAVSDSIKLVNDILYFFVNIFYRFDSDLGDASYRYLYPYAHFINFTSSTVSSWLTVSVAVERYILVCHPTRAKAVWSRKRAVVLCVIIYIVVTSILIPCALRYELIPCVDRLTNESTASLEVTPLWKNEQFAVPYNWVINLLRTVVPLIILVVLNARIIHALRQSRANRRNNARHRVTVMMIVVIVTFLICTTPDAILSTVFNMGYTEAGYLAKGIREFTDTLLPLNAAVNFIIYCAFNQVFRNSFKRLCCQKKKQGNSWITELDESTYRRLSEAKSAISSNNNSPPRHDTVLTLVSEASATDNPASDNKAEARGLSSSSSHTLKGYESGMDTTTSGNSNSTNTSEDSQAQLQRKQPPHRGTSHGLKKSRNSVKSNRGKRRGKDLEPAPKPQPILYIPTNNVYDPTRNGQEERLSPSDNFHGYSDPPNEFHVQTTPESVSQERLDQNEVLEDNGQQALENAS